MSSSDLLHEKAINKDKEILYLFSYIAEQSPDIIVITDFEGNIIYVNPKFTQQTGYTFEDVKGKNVRIMKSKKTPSSTYEGLWDTITKGEEWRGEFYNKKKNGVYYWESAFIAPIKTSEGVITHFFKIAQDITDRKRTENKLQEREEQYRTLVEITPDAITMTDLTGKIIVANQQALKLHGVKDEEELTGKSVFDLIAPEDHKRAMENQQETLKVGSVREKQYRMLRKDGSSFSAEFNASLLRDAEGNPKAFIGVTRDITKYVEAETALKEKEKRYRALFDHTNDCVFILDLDLVHLEVNQRAADILDYTTEELKGMPVSPLVGKGEYEDSLRIREALLAGEKIPVYERILRRKDGSEFPVEINVTLAYDDEGAPLHIQSVVSDITERKQAEIALKEREKRYRALFDHTNDAVFIISLDLTNIEVNQRAADMLGYTIDELIGMHISQIVTEYEYPDSLQVREALLAGEKAPVYERIFRKKDGTEFPVEVNVAMVFDATGAPLHIQSVVRDITERKRVEEKLRKSATAINELNESLTIINRILRHDILNDMMVIQGNLDLYRENKDKNDLEQAYKIINKSVELINHMRELEHLISHEKALQNHDMRQIVDKILENYENYDVKFNIKGEGSALADHALPSVIENLIQNALIHANSDHIDIFIDEKEEFCEFRIADYGSGIPDKIKSKIFEAGFKYGKTGRTGLGLYIVKKVIERYQGKVWIENNTPKGSIFVLRLNK
ncbi:MAG: PAS domain S-box protein [Candidatus Hermodarchaeota archaeon]